MTTNIKPIISRVAKNGNSLERTLGKNSDWQGLVKSNMSNGSKYTTGKINVSHSQNNGYNISWIQLSSPFYHRKDKDKFSKLYCRCGEKAIEMLKQPGSFSKLVHELFIYDNETLARPIENSLYASELALFKKGSAKIKFKFSDPLYLSAYLNAYKKEGIKVPTSEPIIRTFETKDKKRIIQQKIEPTGNMELKIFEENKLIKLIQRFKNTSSQITEIFLPSKQGGLAQLSYTKQTSIPMQIGETQYPRMVEHYKMGNSNTKTDWTVSTYYKGCKTPTNQCQVSFGLPDTGIVVTDNDTTLGKYMQDLFIDPRK